ncbi:RING-H2 finger protein ATL14-like [Juglans microcarpa x Juglans regia]|uniref:RING-H2 finger protein ATL14-like n=1 Tax=Juglans microcarpa x Juglans regia TaxID=2249226 RepID=UPI001B7E0227|nr:RING-H2 finger protein ATL14-like [Juglans microcarpa x Juglans regia]
MNTLPISSIFSLLFLLVSIMFCFRKQFYKLNRLSIVWKNVVLVASRLTKLLDLLLYHSFSKRWYEHDHHRDMAQYSSCDQERRPTNDVYEWKPAAGSDEEDQVECAVCLCKIEEGEEIRELRCDHIFHRICLDRWLGYNRVTCPLCRDSLFMRRNVTELGVELLHFKYCCLNSVDRRQTWWLR